MIPPALIGMIYGDGDVRIFHGFLFFSTSGSLLLIIFRKSRSEIKIRSGFIVVICLGLFLVLVALFLCILATLHGLSLAGLGF